VVSSHGVRIGIRATDADVLNGIERLLPPGCTPSTALVVDVLYSIVAGGLGPTPAMRRLTLVYGNDVRLGRGREIASLYDALESAMQAFVAEAARTRVFVHAAVVEWRGRAIVMPGNSFAGKSTLATAFVRAGGTYYSDEYAVFDEQGRVHPYPRPIVCAMVR
jgi:serine kinase of HPr protein (carbohydrate metabolism regulator)